MTTQVSNRHRGRLKRCEGLSQMSANVEPVSMTSLNSATGGTAMSSGARAATRAERERERPIS